MGRSLRAALAVRIARVLYGRWESLSAADRERLEELANDVKERALELRGKVDDGQAERELEVASGELADAMGADEVAALRRELREELERLEREQHKRRAA